MQWDYIAQINKGNIPKFDSYDAAINYRKMLSRRITSELASLLTSRGHDSYARTILELSDSVDPGRTFQVQEDGSLYVLVSTYFRLIIQPDGSARRA